ncbi:MAG: hypothetical protein AB1Z98_39195 [Nannocystaceae bacterium]
MRVTTRLVVAAMLGAWGCRGGASLDVETDSQGDTQTESTSTGTDSEGTPGTGPAICEPGCQPALRASWTHDGEVGDRMATGLVRGSDGSLTVGVGRAAGGLRVVQLSADGELRWSVAPQLPCSACELTDLVALPSGDLLLSVTEPQLIREPAAIVARLDAEGTSLSWTRRFVLGVGSQVVSRAGAMAVLGDDRIAVLQIEGFSDNELLLLRELSAEGTTEQRRNVQVQAGTLPTLPLLAVASPLGDLVLSYPYWNGEEDPDNPRLEALTTRHLPPSYERISRIVLPLPLDELAIDSRGRRVELSRSADEQSTTLLLTSRSAADLEGWSSSLPLVTTSSTRAALATGPGDEVYVAARTTPRAAGNDFFVVELAVARWSPQGQLQWQAALPLDMLATDDPLELVVDEDHGLVVATVVEARLKVVRFEQACACE